MFQAVGHLFFGLLTKPKASATGEFDDDSITTQTTKLIKGVKQFAMSSPIRGSFPKPGLDLYTTTQSFN
jgi:hypothetical protein